MMKMMISKLFCMMIFAVAMMAPTVTARMTLLRLGNTDQYLRGLSTTAAKEETAEEMDRARRELWSFWSEDLSVSISMLSTETPDVPEGLDFFDIMSLSMSMEYEEPAGLLPEDFDPWVIMSMSISISTTSPPSEPLGEVTIAFPVVDDAPSPTTTTTEDEETVADDASGSNTDSANKGTAAFSSSGTSTPQTVLFIVLVGAAMAVLAALFIRKNQRAASSNASMMTPVSSPLI